MRPAWLRVGILAGLTAACTADPTARSERYVHEGNQYAARGQYREAAISYDNAIHQTPDSLVAHTKRAEVAEHLDEADVLASERLQVAQLAADDIHAQLQAGAVYLWAGRYQDAQAAAEAALRLDRSDSQAHLLKAEALFGAGDAGQTEIELRRAVALQPQSPDARTALGSYYWSMGRYSDAERELRQAIAEHPDHLLAHRSLALLYVSRHQWHQAEDSLNAIARAPSGDPFAVVDYLLWRGELRKAEEALNRVAAASGHDEALTVRRATLLFAMGDQVQARAEVDRLARANPTYVPALLMEARFDAVTNRLDTAIVTATQATRRDPKSFDAAYLLGLLQARAGRFHDAQQTLVGASQLNPASVNVLVMLARLGFEQGDPASGLRWAERARHVQPLTFGVRELYTRALLRVGQLQEALGEARACATLWPRSSTAPVLVGMSYAAAGDDRRAAEAFSKALKIDSSSVEALTAITDLDIRAHQPDLAMSRVRTALRGSAHSKPLLLLAARVSMAGARFDRAALYLKEILRLSPSDQDAHRLFGSLLLRQKLLSAALEHFDSARRVDLDGTVGTVIAGIRLALGQQSEARVEYESVLAAHPHAAIAANNLALIYQEEDRLDDALRWARVAHEARPHMPAISDTLGWILLRRNKIAEALPLLANAAESEPRNPVYQFHVATAYTRVHQPARARSALTLALGSAAAFPEREEATELLHRLTTTP